MFTRRKVVLIGVVCFLFLVADLWVYHTLRKAFVSLADSQVRETAGAALEAVPHEHHHAVGGCVDRRSAGGCDVHTRMERTHARDGVGPHARE